MFWVVIQGKSIKNEKTLNLVERGGGENVLVSETGVSYKCSFWVLEEEEEEGEGAQKSGSKIGEMHWCATEIMLKF